MQRQDLIMLEHECEERMEDVNSTKIFGWNSWKDQMGWGRWCKERGLSRRVRSLVLNTSSLRCQGLICESGARRSSLGWR